MSPKNHALAFDDVKELNQELIEIENNFAPELKLVVKLRNTLCYTLSSSTSALAEDVVAVQGTMTVSF